jgi:hypothetical protein
VLIYDIVIASLLLFLALQDFLYKQISWILIPILFILLVVKSYLSIGMELMPLIFKNLIFIIIQTLALYVFYFLKNKKFVNVVNSQIGLGDILFFIAITPAFSLYNFVLFYAISILITLIVAILLLSVDATQFSRVPLAGYFSLLLIPSLFFQYFNVNFSSYDDAFLTTLFALWK